MKLVFTNLPNCAQWHVVLDQIVLGCNHSFVFISCSLFHRLMKGVIHLVIVSVCIYSCSMDMDMSSRLAVWQELAESCGLSTVQQGLQQVWRLLLLCLICRLCFRLGELR